MEIPFKHIVTQDDISNFPEVFENTIVGQEVELTDEQYAQIGLELHIITEDDLVIGGAYDGFGFIVGEKVEKPLIKVELGNDTEATS